MTTKIEAYILSFHYSTCPWSIYISPLEIEDTTDTDRSASYLDLHLEIDSEDWLR